MTESTTEKPTLAGRAWRTWQWVIAIPLSLLAVLAALTELEKLAAPEAPVTLYLAAVGLLLAIGILLSPPVFFRLPKIAKIAAYLGIIVAVLFWATALRKVQEAYARTPEGARAAEERAAERGREREADRIKRQAEAKRDEATALLAKAEAEGAKIEQIMEQQNDCLNWRGQLGDLNDYVSESLHNPSSFEHIETTFIVPDEEQYNVLLKFRAENGFGALRSAFVRASMIPETCEILKVTDPTPL